MKTHRAQSDRAMLELLRQRGAVIGPTAGEALESALRQIDGQAPPAPAIDPAPPEQNPKTERRGSPIRRMRSKTEQRFAAYLDRLRADGAILRWRYEAERLQLAEHGQPAVTYTPDFVAWLPGGRRLYFEIKSRFHRDSDTETRRIFLWARQQYGDLNHTFEAYRELDGHPGEFREMWRGEELPLTASSEPATMPP